MLWRLSTAAVISALAITSRRRVGSRCHRATASKPATVSARPQIAASW
jgi:hypothetical protein